MSMSMTSDLASVVSVCVTVVDIVWGFGYVPLANCIGWYAADRVAGLECRRLAVRRDVVPLPMLPAQGLDQMTAAPRLGAVFGF